VSRMTWHVDVQVWEAYAAGRLDPAAGASVDAHVVSCPTCRAAAKGHVEPVTLEAVWPAVSARIARPVLPPWLRPLRRLGVPDEALVVLSVASLLVPWTIAVGTALACAMLAGLTPRYQDTTFLLLAPLVPVLAVVAAYDSTDPLRDLTAPTPYSKVRLALLRTVAALAVAVPATMAVGLLIPGLEPLAFQWLLPALGLTLSALVLLTWLTAPSAGGIVSLAWAAAVLTLSRADGVAILTAPGVQAGFAAGAAVLVALFVIRTSTLRLPGGDL
jgi:hypothetical protein